MFGNKFEAGTLHVKIHVLVQHGGHLTAIDRGSRPDGAAVRRGAQEERGETARCTRVEGTSSGTDGDTQRSDPVQHGGRGPTTGSVQTFWGGEEMNGKGKDGRRKD